MNLYGLTMHQDRYHRDNNIEGLTFSYNDPNLVWDNKSPIIRQDFLMKLRTSNHPDDIWGELGMYDILAQAHIKLHMLGRQVKIVSSHPIDVDNLELFNPVLVKPSWDGEEFATYSDRPPSRYVLLMNYDFIHYPIISFNPVFKDGEMNKVIFPLERLRLNITHFIIQKFLAE